MLYIFIPFLLLNILAINLVLIVNIDLTTNVAPDIRYCGFLRQVKQLP